MDEARFTEALSKVSQNILVMRTNTNNLEILKLLEKMAYLQIKIMSHLDKVSC